MSIVLSERQKKELVKLIGCCEKCMKKEGLLLHRIKRGNQGGEYILRNVEVLCTECSKLIHYNEPGLNRR
jgi:hypothetical protein